MRAMKLRLLLMGCILSAIGVIIMATRGVVTGFIGLLGVGMCCSCLGYSGNSFARKRALADR